MPLRLGKYKVQILSYIKLWTKTNVNVSFHQHIHLDNKRKMISAGEMLMLIIKNR